MDLGSSICTPKKPACALCPLNEDCAARARGDQETFPRKAPKKTGTLRRGAAFVVTRGDELLVRTRPEKGLLGGMTEVPGSEWLAGQDDKAALKQAPALKGVTRWHRKVGVVTHVFTHFPLELVIYTAKVAARTRAPDGMRWVPIATLADEALPNVMRKAIAHGLDLVAFTLHGRTWTARASGRHLHDRRLGVEAFDLETGDALVVGGDVFQFLQRQHVGDDVVAVGRALLDHLHHLLGPVAAVEHHEVGGGGAAFGLIGHQRGVGRAVRQNFAGDARAHPESPARRRWSRSGTSDARRRPSA